MDIFRKKWKKFMIFRKSTPSPSSSAIATSRSWNCTRNIRSSSSAVDGNPKNKRQITPSGCFSVYVGPQKQRFLLKAESANHPLFRTLLEDAEMEYGFHSDGPILLPCDVDLFYRVLAEMDCNGDGDGQNINIGCCSPLVLCSPSRRSVDSMSVGRNSYSYGSYSLLGSSRLLKLNR